MYRAVVGERGIQEINVNRAKADADARIRSIKRLGRFIAFAADRLFLEPLVQEMPSDEQPRPTGPCWTEESGWRFIANYEQWESFCNDSLEVTLILDKAVKIAGLGDKAYTILTDTLMEMKRQVGRGQIITTPRRYAPYLVQRRFLILLREDKRIRSNLVQVPEHLEARDPGPAKVAETNELVEIVMAYMADLPKPDVDLLNAFLRSMSISQLAELMGIPPGKAYRSIQKTLATIKAKIKARARPCLSPLDPTLLPDPVFCRMLEELGKRRVRQ